MPVIEAKNLRKVYVTTKRQPGFVGALKSLIKPEKVDVEEESIGSDFSADVRLVQLDVSVTDEEGRPVVGLELDDFEVITTDNTVHVLNAPSPAATSSLAIGEHIANLVGDTLRH